LNGVILYDKGNTIALSADIGVTDILNLEIHVNNMSDCNSVHINDISADGVNIMPTHNYLAKYTNVSGKDTPTNVLEFDGVWNINTVVPLLHWMHGVNGNGWLLNPMNKKEK